MLNILRKISTLYKVLRQSEDIILLEVERDKVIINAGNKSASELQSIASKFFQTAYKLN